MSLMSFSDFEYAGSVSKTDANGSSPSWIRYGLSLSDPAMEESPTRFALNEIRPKTTPRHARRCRPNGTPAARQRCLGIASCVCFKTLFFIEF